MKNTGTCISSLIGGMLIGSVVALLFTPKTGREMRSQIKTAVKDRADKMKNRAEEMRDRFEKKIDANEK